MKKSILNLGKALQKKEQQQINGGFGSSNCFSITTSYECVRAFGCNWYGCSGSGSYCGPNYPHLAPC
jgi:hypothetical protein